MDKNIIDVEYEDVENVIYLSAPQLAKKIGTTEATIRTWADVYGDLIGIEKVNGRKTYKETQVPSFAFIKDLVENKNMKRTQVRNYISKHGFRYAEYDSGLVDTKDPLGFQALASALSVEVNNQLNMFTEQITVQLSKQLNEYLMQQNYMNIEMKAEIESSIEDKISEINKQSENMKDFIAVTIEDKVKDSVKLEIDSLKNHMDLQEKQAQERDNEIISTLRKGQEEKKTSNKTKKSMFSWFKRD